MLALIVCKHEILRTDNRAPFSCGVGFRLLSSRQCKCTARECGNKEFVSVTNYITLKRMRRVLLKFFSTLGAFPNFRQATVSFVISVSMSLRPSALHKLIPQGRFFGEILYCRISLKSVLKIQRCLKSYKKYRMPYRKT